MYAGKHSIERHNSSRFFNEVYLLIFSVCILPYFCPITIHVSMNCIVIITVIYTFVINVQYIIVCSLSILTQVFFNFPSSSFQNIPIHPPMLRDTVGYNLTKSSMKVSLLNSTIHPHSRVLLQSTPAMLKPSSTSQTRHYTIRLKAYTQEAQPFP